MSISSLALRTTNLTISQAQWELRTAAAGRPRVLELSMIQATATAQSIGLGRPQATKLALQLIDSARDAVKHQLKQRNEIIVPNRDVEATPTLPVVPRGDMRPEDRGDVP